MKHIKKISLIVGAISLQFSVIVASEELPLALHLNVRTRWGETSFFQGMPIPISVHLVNAQVRRAEEEAKERWRQEAREAEKEGREPPEYPAEFTVQPSMMIKVADNNVEWFSRVELTIEKIKPTPMKIFQEIRWAELRVSPESVIEEPVILGKDPVWVTLEITPEMSTQMSPGEYRLIASYPDAEPDTFSISIKVAVTEQERAIVNYELAEYSLRHKEYDKAIELAQQALGKLPIDHDMLYLTLGDAYSGKGELEKAIEAYERFLKTYEGSERWHYPWFVRQKVKELKRKIKAQKEEQR